MEVWTKTQIQEFYNLGIDFSAVARHCPLMNEIKMLQPV